jgi:hypothetical protein
METEVKKSGPRLVYHPKHPERTCWGCNLYCPATDLRCGNGTIRTQHPSELLSVDWLAADWRGGKDVDRDNREAEDKSGYA